MSVSVKALFFDVFGTLVDWRTSIAREAEAILKPLGFEADWPAFADAWRGEYQPSMEEVRAGRIPFCKLDVLHRYNLDRVLPRFGIQGVAEDRLVELNLAWHRLDAWPDVAPGLAPLHPRFRLAPVSNGNISLMVNLARRNQSMLYRQLDIINQLEEKERDPDTLSNLFTLAPDGTEQDFRGTVRR
jgi:2-haloacid dehalogenase